MSFSSNSSVEGFSDASPRSISAGLTSSLKLLLYSSVQNLSLLKVFYGLSRKSEALLLGVTLFSNPGIMANVLLSGRPTALKLIFRPKFSFFLSQSIVGIVT